MISLPSMGSIGQLRQTSALKLPHHLTTLESHGGQMHSGTLLNLWATDGQFKEDTGEPTVYAQEINPIKLQLDHQLSGDQLQNWSLVSTYHNQCLNFQCWIADRQENKGKGKLCNRSHLFLQLFSGNATGLHWRDQTAFSTQARQMWQMHKSLYNVFYTAT